MLFEAEEVAHLRGQRQWRQQLHGGAVNEAAPGAPRIGDDVAGAIEGVLSLGDEGLHAGEGRVAAVVRTGEVDDLPVFRDQRSQALGAGGEEGDKAHASPRVASPDTWSFVLLYFIRCSI